MDRDRAHPQLTAARPRVVAIPAGVAVAGMVASRVPGWSNAGWDVAWTAAALAALAGMLLARRAAPPADRSRWTLWAAASVSWLAGQMLWNLYGVIGFPRSPNMADLGWWGFALLVIVSLSRSRARSRSVRIVALFEAIPVAAAAVALSFAELWRDASISPLPVEGRLAALVYPAVYVPAAVLMAQSMMAGSLRGARSGALRIVLGGMAAIAIAFVLWSEQLIDGTYVPGRTLLDPLWVVGLIMIGVGGLIAARRPDPPAEIDEPASHGAALPAATFLLLIVALFQAQFSHAPLGGRITLAIGLLLCGASLVARGLLLEARLRRLLHRERAALAALAERESELARLNAQLLEDSRRDPLTGMRNRRALADDLLELEAARSQGHGGFAVALCDVDHFKAYNDRLGHLAGDQALRTIAATVQSALRAGDVAYRFGGEELLLILRRAGAAEALAAAERVRGAVERAAIAHPAAPGDRLTLSIGVAVGDEDSSLLLARADAALYAAKHGGRNRVSVASGGDPAPAIERRHAGEPVTRHLAGMLTVSRAAAAGTGPLPVLRALAEVIRSELSFHVVAVNVLDAARENLECVIVLGDTEARDALLGSVNPWSEWDRLLRSRTYDRGGAVWLPHGSDAWVSEPVSWAPAAVAAPGAEGWHPDDMLLLPLRGQDGEPLGVVSVDQPASGRRPDDGEIAVLMAVADHAGLALEQTQRGGDTAAPAQSAELKLAAVMLLAETLDLRDPGTARHSRTVGGYARQVAVALGLPDSRVEEVHSAGVLHDLGKLGIADAILYKPGRLTDAEWAEIQRHPEIGARILDHAGLHRIATWVRAHHERIDGRGYPHGLAGDSIAIEARILAVADAYEAMTADRPYRTALSPAAAREELLRCAGTQFDPDVVEAFLTTLPAPDDPVVIAPLVEAA